MANNILEGPILLTFIIHKKNINIQIKSGITFCSHRCEINELRVSAPKTEPFI